MDGTALGAGAPARGRRPAAGRAASAAGGPRTAAGAIAAALRDDIVGMVLLPRTPLRDAVLCERFGTSRTPVREALIRLGEEGLVDILPQSGTFVSRIPVEAIPEAVLVRQALEGVTVEAAAARGRAGATARLDEAIASQRELALRGDTRSFHDADEAFHEAIAGLAGLPNVWRLLRQVKVQIDRARRLTLPALGRMDQVVAEHAAIRDAVAGGDVAAARAAMTAHLGVVVPDVARLREVHPDYFT
ncbi:GntR family transcriptional regulator [Lichenibacterium dinghuense]|uniref:GntR family transcriptional regulator n=1 Tax=Lichenibacterium dinghuense TaxID=2895977 RepID=UPI001F47F29F|nr:GntR family transcriptional regulator [Lichenibacterium sp. 6Y81]